MSQTKFVLAAALSVLATGALAEYPDKPVTYIMPHAPGGGTDIGIRTWAPYVEPCLGDGTNIVVTPMPAPGALWGSTRSPRQRRTATRWGRSPRRGS